MEVPDEDDVVTYVFFSFGHWRGVLIALHGVLRGDMWINLEWSGMYIQMRYLRRGGEVWFCL